MATIGENIKKLREQRGMSQSELAAKIGKSRTAIWQYERGETIPRMGAIEELALVFGVKKSAIIENRTEYGYLNLATDDERELITGKTSCHWHNFGTKKAPTTEAVSA